MAKKLDKEGIQEKIDEGQLLCRNIVEILGKPKEHVEETTKKVIGTIEDSSDYIILKKKVSEAEEQKDEGKQEPGVEQTQDVTKGVMYSQYMEIEMLVKNMSKLVDFVFDYMPSSIEIMEPEQKIIKADQLNFLFNDIVGTFHKLDMKIKNSIAENKKLSQNHYVLLCNAIKLAISAGHKKKEDIQKAIGVPMEVLEPLLENMQKKGVINNEGS